MHCSISRENDTENKNGNFVQVYPQGFSKIRDLIQLNPGAAKLYSFLAENIDSSCGAVIADQQFLADQMNVSVRTIQRWSDVLEKNKSLLRIPVAGRVYAYALNPHEVWKGYNNSKAYAAFVTKTLVNNDNEIKKRLTALIGDKS